MAKGRLNHFRVQLGQDGSPFQHDPDGSAFAGRGNDHAIEPSKRTELDRNYGPFGHFLRLAQVTAANEGWK
jgi:hypothetical protein